ncbi:MAG: hypothetical protein GTN78_21465, partial [Gemmatimonadales bacterium]|nr:hypothetical protein [Gemmatimonadales bacterium]
MEKIFPEDELSKHERVERTFRHQPVDRCALHEQMSYNPRVIADYTGKSIQGFNYTVEDIGCVIRQTMDTCFPLLNPRGTGRYTDSDGFVFQNDNWTTWHVSRPFSDVEGARDWLLRKTEELRQAPF